MTLTGSGAIQSWLAGSENGREWPLEDGYAGMIRICLSTHDYRLEKISRH